VPRALICAFFFGQAALNMAVDAGVRVIATTRGRERIALLE
jgi:NADPH:quinone reductase